MITIGGEALIDVVMGSRGPITAHPGGAPFNVARTIACLGGECQFVGKLSDDAFGKQLRVSLDEAGVRIAVRETTTAPTTLAIARLDEFGTAAYRFYLQGTSATQLAATDVPPGILDGSTAIALGGLGLLLDPTASSLTSLIAHRPPGAIVMLDPNCRPVAASDPAAYREMLDAVIRQVDIVKVSTDDLRFLRPQATAVGAARGLLELGPAAVLVTDGPAPVRIHTRAREQSVAVPVVDVVDTIGAGDAFVAAFLTWWTAHALTQDDAGDADVLLGASTAAVAVAAANCTMPGAALPAGLRWPTGPRPGSARGLGSIA